MITTYYKLYALGWSYDHETQTWSNPDDNRVVSVQAPDRIAIYQYSHLGNFRGILTKEELLLFAEWFANPE